MPRDMIVLLLAGVSYRLVARSVVQLSETKRPWYMITISSFLYFHFQVGQTPGVLVSG
jgi:hypothetical protein